MRLATCIPVTNAGTTAALESDFVAGPDEVEGTFAGHAGGNTCRARLGERGLTDEGHLSGNTGIVEPSHSLPNDLQCSEMLQSP